MYEILAHLELLLTPLQRGGFPTFASALNSFIDITNKAIKGGTTFVNSNYKSSHVASIISWIMLIRIEGLYEILKIRLRSL